MIVLNSKIKEPSSNLTEIDIEVEDFKDIKRIMKISQTKLSKVILSGGEVFIRKCMRNNDLKRNKLSFMTF